MYMTVSKEVITRLFDKLLKTKFPEITDITIEIKNRDTFRGLNILYVNIYFDYTKWWHKNGKPTDYSVVEKLDEEIESSVKSILKYLNIKDSIVNVFDEEDRIID